MTVKTSTPRVASMRSTRAVAGLTRWELSPPPHPDDRPAVKALAEKLARKRAKLAAPRAG